MLLTKSATEPSPAHLHKGRHGRGTLYCYIVEGDFTTLSKLDCVGLTISAPCIERMIERLREGVDLIGMAACGKRHELVPEIVKPRRGAGEED